ncbi:MAG TPA: ABC transporter [Arthrobacter bacterium]|jgi:energy-coupling factor transport system ATP-binding protein|nr:ABC transporter [Arthrobacter sp.]HAP91415.1 ABC transporter [Arthrobacter sp.]HBH59161.1 ABC transporter [Arthrobacter sp.]HCB58522.1 ABC transporter [Arthrobacter sp.]HCC38398.1 ABC transporter [Arthrobacter sp.]
MTAITRPALRVSIDAFTYHGAADPALAGVELEIARGSLTVVLGGSGSGKSTLGRLLAGWLPPGHAGTLRGSLELAGTRLAFRGTRDDPRINPAAWSQRVAFVPQDAATILSTVRSTVAEELAFGLENRGVPRPQMVLEVERVAAAMGLGNFLDRDPNSLSGGEMRRLAIACAVISGPDVLILDEPLGSLDPAGSAEVADLVRTLLARGTAVVLLGQAVDGLAGEAGRWVVLDGGAVTAAGWPAQVRRSTALAASGVRLQDAAGPGRSSAPARPSPSAGTQQLVLELDGVGYGYGSGDGAAAGASMRQSTALQEHVLQDVDFSLRAGEIVAVTGPNGAGKSTLLRHFNGLLRPSSGEVRVCGTTIAGVPVGRVAASVGLLFQHPRDQLFERTALREVSFGLRPLHGPAGADALAREALAAVGLSGAAAVHPADLPASQQRLLALATVLARRPAVLALDEPTVGLDRHGMERLQQALQAAAVGGIGVVFVTHDAAYARATSHRILELHAGRLQQI